MSVGYPAGKGDIDSTAGGIALAVRDAFQNVVNFKAFLDSQTDQQLTNLGYTAGDISNLRSAYVDLTNLGAVYRGESTQPQTDFRRFAKLLTGVA